MVWVRKCEATGLFRKERLDVHLGHRMQMEAEGENTRERERNPEELNVSVSHGRREQLCI